jgi:amidophosphoribosyltransferase
MSDQIKHECGIAMIRLLKPLEFYLSKYGTSFYALRKLHLLMQKQHNRGQDGAGIGCVKLDMEPGQKYINRIRSNSTTPIKDIFSEVYDRLAQIQKENPERLKDINWLKSEIDFTGELFLGHLRYGTYGKNTIKNLHPFLRANNWKTRNLLIAGNFNLTNVDELFGKLVELGQYPIETSDTITILEKIGHFLDKENEILYKKFRGQGHSKQEVTTLISNQINLGKILERSATHWDGGYTLIGAVGHGDAFVLRDPAGIRPAYYYHDDEVFVAASECPVIQTAFNVPFERIKEVKPGNAIIVKRNGQISENPFIDPLEKRACSFERIYFSRGNDADIYKERKRLGKAITPAILKAVDYDLKNSVFSFIPNTAAVAFRGMVEELNAFCKTVIADKLFTERASLTKERINEILHVSPRVEEIAVKDIKLRTFITEDNERDDLVGHVYDVTYGVVQTGVDNLIVIDDSIVRGTTLKQSIIRILDRLGPRKIVVASSAPQIRYPDCYGIDMAKLNDFIAFRAAIELLHETKQENIINEVYQSCVSQLNKPLDQQLNYVKEIYKPFSAERISEKISQLLTPADVKADVQIIYQTIEDLHEAIPDHQGDWYFTGNYPTPGGNKVVTKSFLNYIEGKNERAY